MKMVHQRNDIIKPLEGVRRKAKRKTFDLWQYVEHEDYESGGFSFKRTD